MDKFTTLSVTVTEEIDSNKLLTFIRTQIKMGHLLTTKDSYFYFRFVPQALKYEIILFQELKEIESCSIFSFSHLCNDENQFTLFVTSHFFTLYQAKSLLFVKNISDISIKDITSYVEQTYKIKLSNIVILDNIKLKHLSKQKMDKKDIFKQLYKVVPNNSFKYFIIYLSTVFLVFFFFLYENYSIKNSKRIDASIKKHPLLTKEEQVYLKYKNNNITEIVIGFLDFIKRDNIQFKDIEYLQNYLKIKLISTNKKQLLDILKYPKKRLILKSIQEDSNTKQYIMEVLIHD